jgi:hypothetical protein
MQIMISMSSSLNLTDPATDAPANLRPRETASFDHGMLLSANSHGIECVDEGPYLDTSVNQRSLQRLMRDLFNRAQPSKRPICVRGIKNALLWSRVQRMTTRQTRSAIVTIEVISWVAITAAMGLILTVIASGIYGSLGIAH